MRIRIPITLICALAALATLPPAGAAARASAAAHACPGADAGPYALGAGHAEVVVVCLVNRDRRMRGLRPLRANGGLARAARGHSRVMVRSRVFAHGDMVGRLRATGYVSAGVAWVVGENIAWGSGWLSTPREIELGWMHSPGHRANILSSRYREIGAGVALGTPGGGGGGTYTTDFGARR